MTIADTRTRQFFVMLSLSDGGPTPMIDESGDPHLFDTEEEATEAAKRNPLGEAYHFEVYEWDGN